MSYGAIATTALAATLTARDLPFASFFVDPFADYSNVHLPAWNTNGLELRTMDHVVAVDGRSLHTATGELAASALQRALRTATERGSTEVTLTIARDGSQRSFRAAILQVGPDEQWLFFGMYALVGLAILWLGLVVLRAAPHRAGAIAYAALSFSGAVFLTTFFDYHTTRWLTPLFAASTVTSPIGLAAVALTFPSSVVHGATGRAIAATVLAIGAAVAATVSGAVWLGADLRLLRGAVNILVPSSLVFLAVVMAWRFRSAAGAQRRELRTALFGLCAAPAVLAIGYGVTAATSTPAFHLLLPFVLFLVPAAIGRAMLRHNILDTTRVLEVHVLVWPLAVGALLIGGSVWWSLQRAGVGIAGVAIASTCMAGVTALGGWRLGRKVLFPATAQFRPTIEQLTAELGRKRASNEIVIALRALVTRWLPTQSVDVELGEPGAAAIHAEAIAAGRPAWTNEPAPMRRLLVPMRFAGQHIGTLIVGPKDDGALFTAEDLALLETIASLGALALSNARTLEELESLRSLEIDASRAEQRFTVDALAAEMAHEIAYPVNYFRHLLRELASSRGTEEEDIEIGREELERLERMLNQLRRLQVRTPEVEPIALRPVVDRAVKLLTGTIDASSGSVEVDVDTSLCLHADADGLLQLCANLLRNALQATPTGGLVVIRAVASDHVAIEFRDQGAGVPEALRSKIFQPWFTTRRDGAGMGLSVSQRIARGFGWTLEVAREDGWTVFRVRAPRIRIGQETV